MKFRCNGCGICWTTFDEEPNPPMGPLMRSCPECMRKQGYRWTDVLGLEFEAIPEAA